MSIKALVRDDQGRILLCRQSNDRWDLLGGGLDHGESPIEGLKREIREESGLEITAVTEGPLFFMVAKHEKKDSYFANIFYEVDLKDLNFKPTEECEELVFWTPLEILQLDTNGIIQQLAKKLVTE